MIPLNYTKLTDPAANFIYWQMIDVNLLLLMLKEKYFFTQKISFKTAKLGRIDRPPIIFINLR